MNRRHRIYIALIALLAIANVGNVLMRGNQAGSAGRGGQLQAENFRLLVDTPSPAEPGRNLFMPGGEASAELFAEAGAHKKSAAPNRQPSVPAAPLAASAPDLAQAALANGLGKIRLLGVVFRGNERKAFLSMDKDNIIVAAGQSVFGDYSVENISIDAVEIRDVRNNLTRKIPVSGK